MVGAWFVLLGDGGEDEAPVTRKAADRAEAEKPKPKPKPEEPELPPMECPTELTNCEVASGRVIYVEAVDPDGDGDAHFVTLSNQSITTTGITIFDVRKDLRPDPLPGRGDLVGGLGPVYEGSHGQKQIEVIEFHVGR